MNNLMKKAISVVITVTAVITMSLPYARFVFNGQTVTYKPYKSLLMLVILAFIICSSLMYGDFIKIHRTKTELTKLVISVGVLFLSLYRFANYSDGLSIKNEKSLYAISKVLGKEVGFQRQIGIYLLVLLALSITILNLMDFIRREKA